MGVKEELSQTILSHVLEACGGADQIESTEENCGSLWINLKNGDTMFVMVEKCEPENVDP